MGGSGDGWGNRRFPRSVPLDDLLSASGDRTEDKFNQTEVESNLREKLKDINDHSYDAIDKHRQEIQKKLDNEYEDVEIIRYGGSHSRHTDVSHLSDIDILAPLGASDKLPESSNEAITQLAATLRERFPRSKVDPGKMAVTVTFSDGIEVQVLPAYRHGDGYKIPDPSSSGWVTTYPTRFARQLTDVNQRLSGQVVPTIKLAKKICASQAVDVNSYHLENIAVASFNHYTGERTLSRMLQHLFNQAKKLCLTPIPDPCGQSQDVAGNISAGERQQIAKGMNRIEGKISRALASASTSAWDDLFGE